MTLIENEILSWHIINNFTLGSICFVGGILCRQIGKKLTKDNPAPDYGSSIVFVICFVSLWLCGVLLYQEAIKAIVSPQVVLREDALRVMNAGKISNEK